MRFRDYTVWGVYQEPTSTAAIIGAAVASSAAGAILSTALAPKPPKPVAGPAGTGTPDEAAMRRQRQKEEALLKNSSGRESTILSANPSSDSQSRLGG